jgi:hypothetical protein
MEPENVLAEIDKLLKRYVERVKEDTSPALALADLEVLRKGLPIRKASIRGLEFPVSISPLLASPIFADIAGAGPILQSNVRRTDGEGWWPRRPAGGGAPAPLPGGFGDIPLVDGDPRRDDWDPVNPTPNEHGKAFEFDGDNLTISSAGESVSLPWDSFKPPQPVASDPLPPNPCPDGSPRPTFDEVKVEIQDIKASLREVNCHTTIIVSVTWKITRVRYRCSGLGRDRHWTRTQDQPNDPPRTETKENHRSTRISLPQN